MDKPQKRKHKTETGTKAESSEEQAAAEEAAVVAGPESKPEEEALEMRMLRLQADFDNFRKRVQRERAEWQRQGNERFLGELLPVLDHYELGLNTAAAHHIEQSVIDGFRMVYDQFLDVLRKNEVTPIEAEGGEFDHNLHEAVTFVPSEEHPAHTVIAQTRRGYLFGERLLRPAQVVVSSGPPGTEDPASDAEPETEQNEER